MQAQPQKRQAAMIFILITLFIDILGIGIIIPILPELVKEFVGGDTARAVSVENRGLTGYSDYIQVGIGVEVCQNDLG